MTTNAYIVGGGIFGSVIAHALQDKGYAVTIFDNKKKGAGSKPAACIMKPSWMTSIDYKPPIKLLDSMFGVETIPFMVKIVPVDCFWVDPKKILSLEAVEQEVTEVGDGYVVAGGTTYKGLVVVAAGVWSQKLIPALPEIRALCGSAVIGEGKVSTPTIHVYAPYRQAVWFNRGKNETWFGDGTAIIKKNFNQEHKARTTERAESMAGITGDTVSGQRPYVAGKSGGLFEKLGNRLYVSTGGAKNGTILAAHNALQLLKALS